MIKKLRIKFVCVIMAIVLPMIAVILGIIVEFSRENAKSQNISMMRSVAETPFRREPLGKSPKREDQPFLVVYVDHQGEVIAVSEGSFDLSDQEYLDRIIQLSLESEKRNDELEEYPLRYFREKTREGYTIVFSDLTAETEALRKLVLLSLTIFFVSGGLFLVVSILLSTWAIRPVEIAWDQQRQFVADASHELKTPLSIIMANAELLDKDDTEESDRRKFSQNILTTTYQMRTLVENLLEMARVDNGTQRMQPEPLNFSQLVYDAALSVQLLYEEKGLQLQSSIAEDICLSGCERLLYQVMDVLLDNALKYTPAGGTVRVELDRCGHNCHLKVANTGEPISGEDLKNIFKRFYRVDKARSFNGSYGLGLSIAEAIVQEHRGRIWAESHDGCNTFHVQLPTN